MLLRRLEGIAWLSRFWMFIRFTGTSVPGWHVAIPFHILLLVVASFRRLCELDVGPAGSYHGRLQAHHFSIDTGDKLPSFAHKNLRITVEGDKLMWIRDINI